MFLSPYLLLNFHSIHLPSGIPSILQSHLCKTERQKCDREIGVWFKVLETKWMPKKKKKEKIQAWDAVCSHFSLTPARPGGPVFHQASLMLAWFSKSPAISKDSASCFLRQRLLDSEWIPPRGPGGPVSLSQGSEGKSYCPFTSEIQLTSQSHMVSLPCPWNTGPKNNSAVR